MFKPAAQALLIAAVCACATPKRATIPPLPRDVYARYLEGKLAGYKGDWAAAADELAEAARAAPDQPMIAVELARAQAKAKRTDEAKQTLAIARRKWPGHPQVWLLSGDLLAQGSPDEAIKAYRRGIELQPDDERGYLGLARLQKPDAAESTLRILIAHVPASVDGHYRLAVRVAMRGELDEAMKELRAVLERDPDHIDARLDLARALRRQGHLQQAIAETRSAFDRSGQALDIAEELFWLLCEADDRTAAVDLLTLLDDDRSDVDALAVLARLDRGLGRMTEARELTKRMVQLDRDVGMLAEAELAAAVGDRQGAQRAVASITEDSKYHAEGERVLADLALAAGDPATALAAIDPIRKAHPKSIEAALLAAFALADAGKAADAKAALAPYTGEEAQYARARLADRMGDSAAALAILEPLLVQKPDFAGALNLAGYLLAENGRRLDDAERYLRRARDLSPGDPSVLDSWGWLLYKRGKSRDAVKALDRAARYSPLEPEILVHLAAAWAADGAPKTAAQTLDRAAALNPPPPVQHRIDELRKTLVARRTGNGDTMQR